MLMWAITHSVSNKIHAYFRAYHENVNEDRPMLSQRRCSPMTLVSGNIRFKRIFAGVPWRGTWGSVKWQWGNRRSRFQDFPTLRLRHLRKWGQHHYYFSPLPPFQWPQNTWPWMAIVRSIFTITNSSFSD